MAVTFDIAKNEDEIRAAFKLACDVFSENANSQTYQSDKQRIWESDPYGAEEGNLVLAKSENSKVIGLVRIVPRMIFREGVSLRVAGFSSVCLSPEYRNRGLSRPLMEHALWHCEQRGFDLAFLIARRAVDHYYNKFGFWGISSYNRLSIKLPITSQQKKPVQLLEISFDSDTIATLKQAYWASYSRCFGTVDRALDEYWLYLRDYIKTITSVSMKGIYLDHALVGYVIVDEEGTVYEIAYVDEEDIGIGSLSQVCRDGDEELVLEIPPEHALVSCLAEEDFSIRYRQCSYGGHMIKVLDYKRMADLYAQRMGKAFVTKNAHGLSYEETCRLVGAYSIAINPKGLSFNVSLPDRF